MRKDGIQLQPVSFTEPIPRLIPGYVSSETIAFQLPRRKTIMVRASNRIDDVNDLYG